MTMPRAVLFDLLTALLDSWTVWNATAGSERAGRAWRAEYLRRTYGCGAYRPYETLVREAAAATGLPEKVADALEARWLDLPVWSGAQAVLDALSGRAKLAVVTNCSQRLGRPPAGSGTISVIGRVRNGSGACAMAPVHGAAAMMAAQATMIGRKVMRAPPARE